MFAGILTVSRSAHLAIVLVLLADQFFRKPNYRVPMLALIAFAIAGAWNLGRMALARNGPWSELAAPMFGAFVAVALIVRGVALSFDSGATWLFVAGIAGSLQASRVSAASPVFRVKFEASGDDRPLM
ncbi:MAG: hypothetical protein EXS09_18290 [Gemmataceae bacterium]|nr:hypothetical protein [Gemmataceae bacterium]